MCLLFKTTLNTQDYPSVIRRTTEARAQLSGGCSPVWVLVSQELGASLVGEHLSDTCLTPEALGQVCSLSLQINTEKGRGWGISVFKGQEVKSCWHKRKRNSRVFVVVNSPDWPQTQSPAFTPQTHHCPTGIKVYTIHSSPLLLVLWC